MKLTSITYTIANQVLRAVKTPFSREAEMAQMSMLSEVEVWLSVDPLAEKYPSYSPYNYTVNNPVNYTDPDGREIDVTALKKENSKRSKWLLSQLKSSLSEISGQEISVKKVGKKYILEGSGSCGANCTIGSAFIDHLLNGEQTLKVHSTKSGSEAFRWGDIYLDAAQIKGVQNGLVKADLNPKTMSVGFGFLHEALHTSFGADFYSSEKDEKEKIGEGIFRIESYVLNRINGLREEINSNRSNDFLPMRVRYSAGGFIFKDRNGNEKQIKKEEPKVFRSPRDF